MKLISGKSIGGRKSDGFLRRIVNWRHVSASVTDEDRAAAHVRAILLPQRDAASDIATATAPIDTPKPSASACTFQPSMTRLRSPSIMYETGIERRGVAEPVRLDQVPRQVHRRDDDEEEEERELRLHGLAGARAERDPDAERSPTRRRS